MYAQPGDWLVVKSPRESARSRHGAILAVGDAGGPPYRVRWLDTGHERLVFPGPDAAVVTSAEQLELDRAQLERADRIQAQVMAGRR